MHLPFIVLSLLVPCLSLSPPQLLFLLRSSPTPSAVIAAARSLPSRPFDRKLLERKWSILYTSEKEVNVFVDRGWAPSLASVTQTISPSGLANSIPFAGGGYLSVSGPISPSPSSPRRTDFSFTSAKLSLPPLPAISLPPVGAGWFDTLFLDRRLRVDVNSRGDVLVLVPAAPNTS